ncbi:MAG TPA: GNAT family N-acetyltransferase [Ktedonobacterales bacterium]|nr:GNAT family N-acetyltransferase [Ktedonobacterales bacterium]
MGTRHPPRVAVRAIRASDLERVVELDARVFGEPRRAYFERRLASLDGADQAHHTIGIVAEEDGALIGFVMGTLTSGEFGFADATALVDSIAVHPDWRRRGTGRRLADTLIAECAARGAREVYTLVNWNSWDMLKFFDAIGFSLAQTVPLRRRIGEPGGERA